MKPVYTTAYSKKEGFEALLLDYWEVAKIR